MIMTMTIDLFSQFASPILLGIPLILIAIITPSLLYLTPSNRWNTNRLIIVQKWFTKTFVKQVFLPLSPSGHKWALILTSLLAFLLTTNLIGLLPYIFTPATQLSLSLGLAITIWLATVIIGFWNQPTTSLAHFLPEGTPTPLVPILIIIESISLLIRPLALGVRLTVNLTAGHLLIKLFATATKLILLEFPTLTLSLITIFSILLVLEIAVAMIQAYVFVLLLTLYLQENT